jgi:hypothetical protein
VRCGRRQGAREANVQIRLAVSGPYLCVGLGSGLGSTDLTAEAWVERRLVTAKYNAANVRTWTGCQEAGGNRRGTSISRRRRNKPGIARNATDVGRRSMRGGWTEARRMRACEMDGSLRDGRELRVRQATDVERRLLEGGRDRMRDGRKPARWTGAYETDESLGLGRQPTLNVDCWRAGQTECETDASLRDGRDPTRRTRACETEASL